METVAPLNASVRTEFGKGPSRRLRMVGSVPAIVYGKGETPLHVAVDAKELVEKLTTDYGKNARFRLAIAGEPEGPLVMLKDYQRDPLRRDIVHVDFIAIDPEHKFLVEVPLLLTGRARGTLAGGRLRQVRRTLKIRAAAADIPVAVEHDVTGLKVNAVSRVTEITPPPGVEFVYDANYTVAQVTMPRGVTALAEDDEA